MIDDRNPDLQQLFLDARTDLPADAFLEQVMARVDRARHRTLIIWCCVGVALLAGAWLLTDPLTSVVAIAMQVLPERLVDIHDDWLSRLISPVNSIAGVVALVFLGLRLAYRKIFS